MESKNKRGIMLAILAAALYAISSPFSKLLLKHIPATLMAGFLYIGAGLGMVFISFFRNKNNRHTAEEKLSVKELPYTVAMIILDIAAPIFLLIGLSSTTAANVSLLNNFEIVATAIIALVVFKEKISSKDPLLIVLLKGIFSGTGSIIIGLCTGERMENLWFIPFVLLLGFVAYGLSIYFYVYAQRILGAAKTSAYYAVSPFIGAILSLLIFQTIPGISFVIALIIMLIGAWLSL